MSRVEVLLLTSELIKLKVPRRAEVATIKKSPNRLARRLVKALDMSIVILASKNMNIFLKKTSNVFADRKRLLPISYQEIPYKSNLHLSSLVALIRFRSILRQFEQLVHN